MARQPRFQYPGALYHVMARGNGGEAVFVTEIGSGVAFQQFRQLVQFPHGLRMFVRGHYQTADRAGVAHRQTFCDPWTQDPGQDECS